MFDNIRERCGIFGIWGHKEAARLSYYGLHSLQHRGQDGAGIVVKNNESLIRHKGHGLITEVFSEESLKNFHGMAAIGHVLSATEDTVDQACIQPLLFHFEKSSLALCHNGNLVNAPSLKRKLEAQGSIFQSNCDSELLAHVIKRTRDSSFVDSVKDAMSNTRGGYAGLLLTQNEMIAVRDQRGLRPLVIGRLGHSYVLASETCALDAIGADFLRDVAPGEIIVINDRGMKAEYYTADREMAVCSMEFIYIARPDSNIEGANVHASRKNAGRHLAAESPPNNADLVMAVPDSGVSAAIGYAEACGLPYEIGLIKNRYIGRTFIAPGQSLREQGVKLKLSAVRSIVGGKSIILVDDSIVRGTTTKHTIALLREMGAREIHMKIASPLFKRPCFYGIDLASEEELIAHNNSIWDIGEIIGVDSIFFMSQEGLANAIGLPYQSKCKGLCIGCFSGEYPTDLYDYRGKVE